MNFITKCKKYFLFLLLIKSLYLGGCAAITDVPLLTNKNSDPLDNMEGYYYLLDTNGKKSKPIFFQIQKFPEDGKNLYKILVANPKDTTLLRFKKLSGNWILLESKESNLVNSKSRYLSFLEWQDKKGTFFVPSDKLPTDLLSSYHNLNGHVKIKSNYLIFDEIAVTKYEREILGFIQREFTENKDRLKPVAEMFGSDEKATISHWCKELTKIFDSKEFSENSRQTQKINSAIDKCKRAVELNPESAELKSLYEKALAKRDATQKQ